jgi:hypothetical protein
MKQVKKSHPSQLTISLKVTVPDLLPSQVVYVLGSIPIFGEFKPTEANKMKNLFTDCWYLKVILPYTSDLTKVPSPFMAEHRIQIRSLR